MSVVVKWREGVEEDRNEDPMHGGDTVLECSWQRMETFVVVVVVSLGTATLYMPLHWK